MAGHKSHFVCATRRQSQSQSAQCVCVCVYVVTMQCARTHLVPYYKCHQIHTHTRTHTWNESTRRYGVLIIIRARSQILHRIYIFLYTMRRGLCVFAASARDARSRLGQSQSDKSIIFHSCARARPCCVRTPRARRARIRVAAFWVRANERGGCTVWWRV